MAAGHRECAMQMRATAFAIVVTAMFAAATPAMGQEGGWKTYVDPALRFTIEIPTASFQQQGSRPSGLSLVDPAKRAQLDIFGSPAAPHLGPSALLAEVRQAERIGTVTYQRSGPGWFVLSGYYRRDSGEKEPLIFYAKFMFNRDRSAFSAFEISYPSSEKRTFDGIVTHLEKSLRPPR
jgi:hypothetical protein